MIPIRATYRLFPFPWTRTQRFQAPQSWSEITPLQIKAVVRLSAEQITETNFLNAMTGLSKRTIRSLTPFQRYSLFELFEFLAEPQAHHQFIIKKIRPSHSSRVYYAPDSQLKGFSFGRFIFADSYFSAYQQSKNPDDLGKFIASLYLKKDEKFNERVINQRYKEMGLLNEITIQAILLNYHLLHEWLTVAYPLIFQKVQQKTPASEDKKPKNSSDWVKVFQNFVGDDILNDHLWAEKPVNTIFSYMTRKYKENLKSKPKFH